MKLDTMMEAIEVLARERGVAVDPILDAFPNALVAAYKRSPGAAEEARVTIDPDSGEVTVYAQELDEEGNVVSEWEDTPEGEAFGRIAAQSFKQVMQHKLREAKREHVFEMYEGREGDLVTGLVQQVDYRSVILDLGDAEAILPGSERIPFERLERGNRVKALILEVRNEAKVKEVHINEADKTADVVVSEHQLSLAIGKEGQNARLAARLSGYKVDIRSDQEESQIPVAAAAAPKAPTVEPVEPDQVVSDPVVEPVEPDQVVSDPVVEPVEPDQAVSDPVVEPVEPDQAV